MSSGAIENACEHFGKLLEKQIERVERMKKQVDWLDYKTLDKIIVGILGGDGIGPFIAKDAERVLKFILKEEVESGKIE
ncbi:MAG TPA: isocitrate/isopropylmalate dehydrogenase family protein, partial [bacterium]|nr:isocitrate/isopropylmalate dehydrogenase family protein [bacterium]